MKAAETNSLEEWTKVTHNALRGWHDDTEGIKFINNMQLITRIINVALIVSDNSNSEIWPNIDRNVGNHSLMINDENKCEKIDDKKVIKNLQILKYLYYICNLAE